MFAVFCTIGKCVTADLKLMNGIHQPQICTTSPNGETVPLCAVPRWLSDLLSDRRELRIGKQTSYDVMSHLRLEQTKSCFFPKTALNRVQEIRIRHSHAQSNHFYRSRTDWQLRFSTFRLLLFSGTFSNEISGQRDTATEKMFNVVIRRNVDRISL